MGTSPMLRPARRSGASSPRSSATVRAVLMPAPRGGERARLAHQLVEQLQQLRRGLLDRGALRRDRGLVAARDRAGEGRLGAELGDVLDRLAHQRREQRARLLRLEPGAAGDRLRGGLERHQEVRGHGGGGVVGGAALVVDLERRHAEPLGELGGERERLGRRARHGRAGAVEAHARVGEGLERVQPERRHAGVRQRGQRGGAARVAHQRGGGGDHLGRGRDLGVGHAQQDRVAARRASAAAERALDLDAGVAKRGRERGADPACADYAHPQRARKSVVIWVHSPAGPLRLR